VQPGNTQPPSRTARAVRWATWTTRLARPTSSGWAGAPPRTGGSRATAARNRATGTVGVVVVVGGVAGDQHPGHRAITGQPLARLLVQRPPPTDLATNSVVAAEEAVQVHGDSQLGPDPTGLGEPAPFQGVAGQLGQGVSVALAAAAAVVGVGWAGQGLQGRQEGLAGLGLQQPIHCHHPLEGRRKP